NSMRSKETGSKRQIQNTSADLRSFEKNIVNKSSLTSIQSLNGFVHNKFAIPTSDALRAGWDAAVPVFVATYGAP
ncbi:MAG: hypothetical protein ACOH2H_22495, partial [Cypionkella sp.]